MRFRDGGTAAVPRHCAAPVITPGRPPKRTCQPNILGCVVTAGAGAPPCIDQLVVSSLLFSNGLKMMTSRLVLVLGRLKVTACRARGRILLLALVQFLIWRWLLPF